MGKQTAHSVIIRRAAPARQIDRVMRLGGSESLLHGLGEIVLDSLARDLAAQEIGPQKFAERRRILGKAARAAQLTGQAAIRIVLEILDRLRQILERPALPP